MPPPPPLPKQVNKELDGRSFPAARRLVALRMSHRSLPVAIPRPAGVQPGVAFFFIFLVFIRLWCAGGGGVSIIPAIN